MYEINKQISHKWRLASANSKMGSSFTVGGKCLLEHFMGENGKHIPLCFDLGIFQAIWGPLSRIDTVAYFWRSHVWCEDRLVEKGHWQSFKLTDVLSCSCWAYTVCSSFSLTKQPHPQQSKSQLYSQSQTRVWVPLLHLMFACILNCPDF